MNTYKIVIDTKGSDKGAKTVIKGAAEALAAHESLSVLLVGDEELIKAEAQALGMPQDRYEILDAKDEITNYDSPAVALFQKQDSSLVKALEALSARDDLYGLITAGNTGAVIAGSVRYLLREDRVRPALAAVLPASDGTFTCLVDTGATIDCPASTLVHFAHLGSDFMQRMYKIEKPRVALLSNGAEPTKGNKLVKETHELLKADTEINFVGNVEGNNALAGTCDVLVCDGFAGNQVLKVSEGMATRLITDIVKYAKKTQNNDIMKLAGHLMQTYDLSSLGGGIILGTKKTVIKARGSSGEAAIVNISRMLLNLAENKELFADK
ncbi:MAG: phosphate acyltransferase PlsX [Clostridia bacterium]|nr:phosphate acyltransferase PlsX [Clostridia bacterium]